MELLIKGTVFALLAVVLFILIIIGFFYSWIWWIEILLAFVFLFFVCMATHFFCKDKQKDKDDQVRYSKD